MTADIELLPLPELASERVFGAKWDDFDIQDYARANVAHATAEKDAEIERLRAEVEAVWAAMPRDARYLDPPDGGCVPLHEQVRRMAADATRAERLAEALRMIANQGPHYGPDGTYKTWRHWAEIARAALRDHDQEVGNG